MLLLQASGLTSVLQLYLAFWFLLMLLIVLAVLLSSMLLLTFCIVFFEAKHDKILAANSLSTHVIVLSCLYSTLVPDSNFLDIAYIYTFMGFIGLVGIVNFIFYNNSRHR